MRTELKLANSSARLPLFAVLLSTVSAASLSYNGLAQTPQMGWVGTLRPREVLDAGALRVMCR